MFNLFNKKSIKEVKTEEVVSRFDGKVYRGVWQIGDDIIIGAYVRDGYNSICTSKGIYNIPKGTIKKQLVKATIVDGIWYEISNNKLVELNVDSKAIEFEVECLVKGYCALYCDLDKAITINY